MNVCPKCGMGPRGIESEDGRDVCQNCGHEEDETNLSQATKIAREKWENPAERHMLMRRSDYELPREKTD